MKTHHLRYFVETAAHGSIRAAARTLQLSQTAVAQGLRELEAHAQVSLLQRQGRTTVLTAAGRDLLIHAQQVLAQLQRTETMLARHREVDSPQRLSIGVTPWVAQTLLPQTMAAFRQELPHVQLEFFDGLSALTYPRLRDGSLDLVIGRLGSPEAMQNLQALPLFRYEMTVVARRDHPRAGARSIAELLHDDWILSFMPGEQSGVMDNLFVQHGLVPPHHRIHLAQSALLVLTLLQQSDMLSLCPWPLVEHASQRGQLVALQLRERFRTHVAGIIRRKQEAGSHAATRFTALFMEQVHSWRHAEDAGLRRVRHSVDFLSEASLVEELSEADESNERYAARNATTVDGGHSQI